MRRFAAAKKPRGKRGIGEAAGAFRRSAAGPAGARGTEVSPALFGAVDDMVK
jgi:hypothetical protein